MLKKKQTKRAWKHVNISDADMKRIMKQIGGPAVNELDTMSVPQLKEYVALLGNYEVQTIEAQKNDDELQSAKEEVRNLNASYVETLKDLRARRAYCVQLVSDRE